MIFTCAACAKTLEHDAPAHCVNCQTRYCSDRCLRYHAHRGGHDDDCEEMANGGGAEQHHANKKYEDAMTLLDLERFEEVKSLLRRTLPVAQRVLGENTEDTLKMRSVYADALYFDPSATHDDLREAVETLEDAGQIARRVLCDAHPLTEWIEDGLEDARHALYARGLP